ncbi:hypothetical protein D186_19387 [Citrobacter freundii ATCC 8090 = MTCC 1658 = NBRC 12681]|nr:hypothetical protein D186_19387 [Citrobacter freundii ATCC 8090 = MTCC 1658 = NBRC 12681]EXF30563.1 hypothetical protein V172_10705 [Citrobacter freundii RLS1]GAL40678.1 hypothetical protein CIFRE_16_03240 [Citrobacter freundii ATCC 8090 = MTCC 1658 = NBRC 12681]VDZ64415.1 Uncharacterised protein [Citrobacter freundii]
MNFYFDKNGSYKTYSIKQLKDYPLPFSGHIMGEYFVSDDNVKVGMVQIINDEFTFPIGFRAERLKVDRQNNALLSSGGVKIADLELIER